MAFDVERPGVYAINATYDDDVGPEVILAVVPGFAGMVTSIVLLPLSLLLGSILLGCAVAAVTYTRRKRAMEQQRVEERIIRGES